MKKKREAEKGIIPFDAALSYRASEMELEPCLVYELHMIVKRENPIVLFLVETRLNSRGIYKVRCRLDYQNTLAMDHIEKSGGLAMVWRSESELDMKFFSSHHVDVWIKLDRAPSRCLV